MTNIEITSFKSLRDIATRSFSAVMHFGIKLQDDELINEFITLQIRSYILATEGKVAKIQESCSYNLGAKVNIYRVVIDNKESLFAATVVKNSGDANAKVAAKK